jgi:hypothetical protein
LISARQFWRLPPADAVDGFANHPVCFGVCMLNSRLTMPNIQLSARLQCGDFNPGKCDIIAIPSSCMIRHVFHQTGDSHKKPIRQGFTGKKRSDSAFYAQLPALLVSSLDHPI